jgi:TolB protein
MTLFRSSRVIFLVSVLLGTSAVVRSQQPAPSTPPPQQQSDVQLVISSESGTPPKFAVPDFVAASPDADTAAATKLVGEVLWNDLDFEREFYLIPRDTYASIPPARSITDVPFDRWKELGADGLVIGSLQKTPDGMMRVVVRVFSVRTQQSIFSREYTGPATNPRFFAHTISDEIHQNQRALRGVARTRLTFASDRDRERVGNTVENRQVKEVYISDYDGANQRRVTVNRTLNITPTWAPDGRSIAYTSYRRGFPDIFVSLIFEGTLQNPTAGKGQNWLPAWSPDGTQIAFTSNRDGNPELYVMNRDGSNVRRITNNPAIDTTPTWSPTGQQIAFTSDRSGGPQVYVMGADGLNVRRISTDSYCDRATWSPAPFNELAFVCKTGGGYDIKIFDFAKSEMRQITNGEGSNESPAYAPNGKHIAFTSTRSGKTQIYTVGRDGKDIRQITKVGNNFFPDWSR